MKVARIAVALIALTGLLVFVPGVAEMRPVSAQESCWQAMPWAPLGDAVVATGASASLAVAPKTAPTLIGGSLGGAAPAASAAASGGGAAAAASAVGTAGLALGTFLAASAGTCKFVDWITNDGDVAPVAPYVGLSSDETSIAGWQTAGAECPGAGSTGCGGNASSAAALRHTQTIAMPAFTGSTRCQANVTGFTVGGNVFSAPASSALYPVPAVLPDLSLTNTFNGGCRATTSNLHTYNTATGGVLPGNSFVLTPIASASNCGTAAVISSGLAGLGGNCGLHPNTAMAVHEGGVVRSFFTVNSRAFALGWRRQVHTDALCKDLNSTSESWVRASSAEYWDREVSARIEVPTCPAGRVARIMRAQRVPINQACTVGTVCTNGLTIYEHTLPATLTTVGTVPDWMTCLTAGATCGVPTLTSGVCAWGGFTMPTTEACNPEQIAGTGLNPVTVPKATGTITPLPYVPGTPTSTAVTTTTPPPTPGGGTITVPIEEGTGPRVGYTPLPEETECWPEGWGWFNPADWVLKPIKCAATWAVVPADADLQERLDRFDELRTEPPLSWADQGATYLGGSSMVFAEWSEAGPECSLVLETEVCPREWDTQTAPSIVLGLLIFGLWSGLVFAIWRWF